MANDRYAFEPLGPNHDRSTFSCGETALDRYLQAYATQDRKRKLATVVVLHDRVEGSIVGFYTLSALQIEPTGLPESMAKRLPRRALPATLLGRLAVDRRYQRRGFGELLLLDALSRALRASDDVGSMAVVVDAKSDAARAFYERFGFRRFADDEHRLYIPMADLRQL